MRIAVIRQRYVASGGAERYLDAVLQELTRLGHEVHVFARSWTGQAAGSIRLHRVPTLGVTSFLRALSFASGCQRRVGSVGCDLVFSLERTLGQDVYRAGDGCHREWLRQRARFLPAWRRILDAVNPLHRTLLALERRTFSPKNTGRIIANSHRGRDEIRSHYGFPDERIHVVYNGVDCARFQPAFTPRTGANVVLLFVGSGFERKGLSFGIQALAHLPRHVTLRVAGKGNIHPYLRLANRIGVADRVDYCGVMADVAPLYQTADLLLHPAIYEPFANVCLEALASGLPVITSRVNGVAELLHPGDDGAVVAHPNDAAGLADAVRPFLDRSGLLARSAAARRTAEAHPFSLNVSQTLDVLLRAKPLAAHSAS